MNRRWQRFLALCLTVLIVVTQLQPARAGFGIGRFQIPTSPGDLTNIGKQKAEEAAFEQIAKSLGEVETPLKLDQRTAYKQVQVDNFQPQKLEFTSVQDWLKPLAAGDYWIDLMAFCTQWSIHSPGNGMAYKLAPLQGKSADIISAIFLRGTLHNVNPSALQAIAWRIQAGVSINQWSDSEKRLAHTLIPEYESRLTSDFLDEMNAKYESFRGQIPLSVFPSFDEALGRLGTTGQLVASIKRARQTLTNRSIAADQLPDLLYERTDGLPRQLPGLANPEPVQWNEVKPGLYASFVVQQGNLGNNRLNIRVTPQAVQASNPGGVRVAGAANVASPSQVSVPDFLVTAKTSPGSFIRNVIVQAARRRSIPAGGTFLPESVEAIPIFGELAVTLNIGYAIGQHGAQALVTFMRPAGNGGGSGNRRNQGNTALQNRMHDEGKGKIPDGKNGGENWGNGKESDSENGWRWQDPKNSGNNVRIQPGNPNSSFPGQQNDYVKITSGGKVIGANGQTLPNSNLQEAHIPLSTWKQWRFWNKP